MSKRPTSILFIEDDPQLGQALGVLSDAFGFEWRWAQHFDEALELARRSSFEPDVLVSDYRLPGAWNGLEVIRELRREAGRHIPAILLTADVSLLPDGVRAHRCTLISKPVDGAELIDVIERVTAENSSNRGGAEPGSACINSHESQRAARLEGETQRFQLPGEPP